MLFFKVIGKNRKTSSKLNTTTTKSTEIKVCCQFCFELDRTKYSSSRNFLSACYWVACGKQVLKCVRLFFCLC